MNAAFDDIFVCFWSFGDKFDSVRSLFARVRRINQHLSRFLVVFRLVGACRHAHTHVMTILNVRCVAAMFCPKHKSKNRKRINVECGLLCADAPGKTIKVFGSCFRFILVKINSYRVVLGSVSCAHASILQVITQPVEVLGNSCVHAGITRTSAAYTPRNNSCENRLILVSTLQATQNADKHFMCVLISYQLFHIFLRWVPIVVHHYHLGKNPLTLDQHTAYKK